ncbi:hypothetical protein FRC04_000494 [Tulasnella sp. 424]|nr:hypothetical protein FRC04_000494 [Tulasnella sp. 424]KAG8973869.1 hypothetical protein FRC05_008089 [Tulasnella sp. 425]
MPPRRAQRKEPTPEIEPEQAALTPNHHFLRTNVKWAAICQYIVTFFPAIGVPEFTVQVLEDDLANSTFTIIPKLMHKMLYTTTLDRRINSETWEIYLRKQLVKRDSEMNPMGDDDEPIDWVDLSVESKLDVFSRIIEWPFYNPTRLRQQMNDDDNFARWRAEPIGHDQQRNAYWFIGGERLWIQRSKEPPRVRKPKPKPKKKTAAPKADALPKRRGRPPKSKPSLATESASASRDSSSGPRTRRSKRASVIEASTRPAKRRRMLGTRISSRLHRNEELDEEWQQIPEEWMPKSDEDSSYSEGESKMAESKASRSSKRLNPVETDDNDSDLTELSDEAASKSDEAEEAEKDEGSDAEESDEGTREADGEDEEAKEEGKEGTDAAKQEKAPATTWMSPDDPNWVEWETICVTLEEWKEFVAKFKGSNSTYERQLYRRLTKEFLPYVEEVFEERQRIAEEKRMQELKVHQEVESYVGRKRSTRLAIIESSKEKQREEEAAKAEEDAKHDRARRVEAREQKQVSERERRELEREKRRQERELQELLETQKAAEDEEKEKVTAAKLAAMQEARSTSGANRPIRKSRAAISYTQSPNGTPPPAERESWELACEICGKKGWNIDDGKVITACERCAKWQHTECHDKADDQAGRPRRDWSKVEFLCKSCQKRKPRKSAAEGNKAKAKPATNGNPIQLQTAPHPVPQIHPHPPYHPYTNGHYAPPPPQPYPQPPQGADPNNIRGMPAYVPQPTAPAYGSQYLHSYPNTQAAPYSHQASPYGAAARPLPHANGSSQPGAVPYGHQPVYPQYPPVQAYRAPPPPNPYPSQPHGQAPAYWPGQAYPYPQVPHVPNGAQGQGYPGATQPGQPDKQGYGHGAFDAAQLLAMQAHRAPQTQLAPPPPPSAPMPVSVAIPAHIGANGYAGPTA